MSFKAIRVLKTAAGLRTELATRGLAGLSRGRIVFAIMRGILEMNGESYRLANSKKAQRQSGHGQNANPNAPNEGDPTTKI